MARELIAELYLKYGGNYFSFGGRNERLEDATNELSWIGVEAYDMLGGYNQLGVMRQEFLKQPKFGNDNGPVDELTVTVSTMIREMLENKHNIKGFHFRPSLFQFMGHTYAGPMLGATPDGRKAEEPLAHGMNPMHGRNKTEYYLLCIRLPN